MTNEVRCNNPNCGTCRKHYEAMKRTPPDQEQEIDRLKRELAKEQDMLDRSSGLYRKNLAGLRYSINQLQEAGQALIDRWNTPKWKDAEHTATFISRLEKAIASTTVQSPDRSDIDSIALNAARKVMRDVHEMTIPVDPRKNDQLQAKIQVAIIEAIREAKS